MDFKRRFLTALQAHNSDDDLLKLVRDFQQDLGQSREIYNILEEIWRELGFDERCNGGETQDCLEYLMEKVWFECPCLKQRGLDHEELAIVR